MQEQLRDSGGPQPRARLGRLRPDLAPRWLLQGAPHDRPESPRVADGPRARLLRGLGRDPGKHERGIAKRDKALAELAAFKSLAVSRLMAQHQELERLRQQAAQDDNVRRLTAAHGGTAPYGSCS